MNKWEQRYVEDPYDYTPTRRLTQHVLPLPAGGHALDVACGGGRNALALAQRGWTVDAWDASPAGLTLLMDEAQRRGLAERLRPRQVDLEDATLILPPAAWDLIVQAYFLHRPLFAQLRQAVRPGGWVYVETILDAGKGARRTTDRSHKLQVGELRTFFAAWPVLAEEEDLAGGVAMLLAQRPG